MEKIKIGNFISECRKEKKLTQEQLAEKMDVSVNAVSKWERGLNLPDISKMPSGAMLHFFNPNQKLYTFNFNDTFIPDYVKQEAVDSLRSLSLRILRSVPRLYS